MPLSQDMLNSKPRRMKVSAKKGPILLVQKNDVKEVQGVQQGSLPMKNASRRSLKNQAADISEQSKRLNPESLPNSGSEYRALRLKYLLLEEESSALSRELTQVEDEVRSLEEEKFGLLDNLVVLEGLVDPLQQS